MGRPKKQIEVPGEIITSSEVEGTANPPEQLNAATAGATVITETTLTNGQQSGNVEGNDQQARIAALSGLNAAAFQIITKFDAYGFTDLIDQPLTNNLDFIDLVTQATTQTTSTAVTNEDGQRKPHKAPVLTDEGWHVPS
ncbi:hypothetical protein [Candidatus Symbiopectobacterium sp.]|uniref:hypothetical protein n=1 Tax=Candidatus Symbiopectobacterium sp. TaxID=2816440 RepID=UPI0025BED47B|nr:hypothetical protein [Candidatus Symbiopectobacterium sp.]